MNYKYVFVLGRAGCGKSSIYREMEKRLLASGEAKTCQRIDDFPKLWSRFLADDQREQEGKQRLFSRTTEDGDYRVTDHAVLGSVFDEILREVNADLLQIDKADHVVFVEFARSSYLQAFDLFDPAILEKSLVVYVQVSFETCWARNVARHRGGRRQGRRRSPDAKKRDGKVLSGRRPGRFYPGDGGERDPSGGGGQ